MSTRGEMNHFADFVIVTALEEERDAILKKLSIYQRLPPSSEDVRIYYSSTIQAMFPGGEPLEYRIVIVPLLDMGRIEATAAASDAIRRWHPRYVFMVGIAGGVKENDVRIGDVLVATQVADYELGKTTPDGVQIRWNVHRTSPRILGASRNLSDDTWLDLISVKRPSKGKPRKHIGPIASGDKVIAFSELVLNYRGDWPKLIGVEMEGSGVAAASFQSADAPEFFMIRGVSDLADELKNSGDVQGWRAYACDVAASYLLALLRSGPVPATEYEQPKVPSPVTRARLPGDPIPGILIEKQPTARRVYQPQPPIGREAERDEAITLLRDNRILLLFGAPGQGKSELARYIGVSSEDRYYDGVYEVDLQNEKQIENVSKHIGVALGNTETGNPLKLLESKRVLIILDSFEGILSSTERERVREFLDALISSLSGSSRIIITSRQQFHKTGLVPKAVRSLDRSAAAQLFHRESNELYRAEKEDDISDLVVTKFGGHPLSIKIVARYSYASKVNLEALSRLWEDKWAEIARFVPSLDDKALVTSFELSYSSLEPTEQLFFLAISLLPDGINGNDIRAIWKDQETLVYRVFGTLEQRSLLVSAGRSWKMLGPIFQYAQDKRRSVEDDGTSEFFEPLRQCAQSVDEFYDRFVDLNAPQESDEDPREKNRLIREHFHNIHASIDRRLEPSTKAQTLAAADSVLRLYWAYHNNLSGYKNAIASAEDAVSYLEKAGHIFEINGHIEKAIRCRYYIGIILWLRGNIDKAQPYLKEVLDSKWSTDAVKYDCKRAFAHIEYKNGNLRKATSLYEEVIEEALRIGDEECRIRCHIGLIDAYRKLEEFSLGVASFEALRDDLAGLHPSIRGNVIRGYAYILLLQGKLLEAEDRYQEALSIFGSVSAFGQAHCRRGLGDVYVQMRKLDEAENEFDAATKLYNEARKNPSLGIGLVELGKGRLALARSNSDLALKHFREAVRLFDRQILNEPFELAQAHESIADTLRKTLRLEEALGHYRLALIQYERTGAETAVARVRKQIELLSTVLK